MKISRGKTRSALKIVVYGNEGIGKSTFAAGAPDPLFIDIEGSTSHMNVARTETPRDFLSLLSLLDAIIKERPCRTVVIDSADWAEKLAFAHTINLNGWNSIEQPGYGKGYAQAAETFMRLINKLTEVVNAGINVILTAHAFIRKFEEPDQMGAYDRYELKLDKRNSPALKEWCDLLLFANFKTDIITDAKTKTKKAIGGHRVVYTCHHPAYDAKNRMDLPEELPLDMHEFLHLFPDAEAPETPAGETPPAHEMPTRETQKKKEQSLPQRIPRKKRDDIDPRLFDLMIKEGVSAARIERALGPKSGGGLGYMPEGVKIKDYPADFVDFVFQNLDAVKESLNNHALPFTLD